MQLLPNVPDGCSPRDHTYDRILFRGEECPIILDTTIKRNYIPDAIVETGSPALSISSARGCAACFVSADLRK